MSKKQVIILSFFLLLVFLLLKPYNQLCKMVNWCEPVSFSYLAPSLKGEKSINFKFKTLNEYEDVDFRVISADSILLRSGSKYSVKYEVINNSNENIKVRPMRSFDNNRIADYLKFHECLCFQSYEVGIGEKLILSTRFALIRSIDDDFEFKSLGDIEMSYEMMLE